MTALTSTETAYQRVMDAALGKGLKVRRTSDYQSSIQCPAHDDKNPSCSITDVDGQTLVYCHAGCPTPDVVAALDLTMADLFDNKRGVDYTYQRADFEVARIARRTVEKKFSQTVVDKQPILYRLPELLAAKKAGETIYLTEGEKDANALARAYGVTATTAPMGAANFKKVDASPLHGAVVVAIVDHDQAGQEWAAQVQEALGSKAKSLSFVRAGTGKDAADHIAAGLALDELIELEVESDEPDYLSAIESAGDLEKMIFPDLQWAVPGLIPEGFGLLTGPPKAGKSWAVLGICLAVASGGYAFEKIHVGPPRPVLYLALEDGPRRLKGRIRYLLGDDAPFPKLLDYATNVRPVDVMPTIRAWLAKHGHLKPLVVLDTLGKVMPPALPGEGAYNRDYRIGSELKRLVDAHPGSCLIVVHHVNKRSTEGGDWMDSTSGTNGLNGAADWTLNLSRRRNEDAGLVRVTGRDVAEGEYAVTSVQGRWALDGEALAEAAKKAEASATVADLGDTSTQIVRLLEDHPEGLGPTNVGAVVGLSAKDAGQYLGRLAKAGRIRKDGRGIYRPLLSAVETVESVETGDDPSATFDRFDSFDTAPRRSA